MELAALRSARLFAPRHSVRLALRDLGRHAVEPLFYRGRAAALGFLPDTADVSDPDSINAERRTKACWPRLDLDPGVTA